MGLVTEVIREIQADERNQDEKEDGATPKKMAKKDDGENDEVDQGNGDAVDEQEQREKKLFRKSQRILEQITPEALIVSLKRGNPFPITVIDEFKVYIYIYKRMFISL